MPFILDDETGLPVHEALVHMADKCVGRVNRSHLIVSARTALAHAYDLRDFLRFLRSHRTTFDAITAEMLYDYAGTMANRVSPFTQETYSHLTIERRVGRAIDFAVGLCRRGSVDASQQPGILALWRNRLPTKFMTPSRARWRLSRGRGRRTLLPTLHKHHEPFILDEDQARRLLNALQKPARSRDAALDAAIARRNYLMAKLSLAAGLRREEVCCLTIGSISSIVISSGDRRLIPLRLDKTKNNVSRKVLVPAPLLREIDDFVREHRWELVRGSKTSDPAYTEPVFPARQLSPRGRRTPMSPQTFGLAIRKACLVAGLTRPDARRGPTTAKRSVDLKPLLSTHDLRHTYAVWTYLLLRNSGDRNPWIYIQAQLGHRSSETTINVYLSAVRTFEAEMSDLLISFVQHLSEGATVDEQI